jgi:tetratricopeptide (TPR) repeat protein
VAGFEGRLSDARSLMEEVLEIRRELGHRDGMFIALAVLGELTLCQGDYCTARSYYTEFLALGKTWGDGGRIACGLDWLGDVALCEGDLATARSLFNESLNRHRSRNDREAIARRLADLGGVAHYEGDLATARALFEESMQSLQEPGQPRAPENSAEWILPRLARTVLSQGNAAGARALFVQALQLQISLLYNPWSLVECIEGLAAAALAEGRAAEAGPLLGCAAAAREAMGTPLPPIARLPHERQVDAVRAALGDAAFAAAWEQGQGMTLDQAIDQVSEGDGNPVA